MPVDRFVDGGRVTLLPAASWRQNPAGTLRSPAAVCRAGKKWICAPTMVSRPPNGQERKHDRD